MDWLKLGKVKGSKNKKIIINALNKPKTPTELSQELKIARSTCSSTLLELETMQLVKCLTPELKLGRLYQLTEEGEEIKKEIKL
ncbi:MAG: ArsR family transcriptional regulator [Candidatus Nanoarchaeia archaeon]|jgi:DNA-binding MarR family transcriptional regulator